MNAQDLLEGDGDLKSLIGTDKSQKRPIPHIWSEVGHPSCLPRNLQNSFLKPTLLNLQIGQNG